MLFDCVNDLKNRIVTETGYKSVVITDTPAVYNLNTAYIQFPQDYVTDYCISSDAMSNFTIQIDFVTNECDATRIDSLYKNIEKSYKAVNSILKGCIDRLKANYCDGDIEAVCYNYSIAPHQWQTSDKILISTKLTLSYKAIVRVQENPLNSN